MLYATTDKFLRVFGLTSLADLPETEALDVANAAQAAGAVLEERDKDQLSIDSEDTMPAEGANETSGEEDSL